MLMLSAIFKGELFTPDKGERIGTVDESENSFENENMLFKPWLVIDISLDNG